MKRCAFLVAVLLAFSGAVFAAGPFTHHFSNAEIGTATIGVGTVDDLAVTGSLTINDRSVAPSKLKASSWAPTGEKFYRDDGAWAEIQTGGGGGGYDNLITLPITGPMIDNATLTLDHFPARLRPIAAVDVLPFCGGAEYPESAVVYLKTDYKLYRCKADFSWTTAVPSSDVTGTFGSDSIAVGAILADRIAAGAVSASKLAASAVTADKMAANSVTALAVGTNQIVASSANIANAAVKTANIADLNVTTLKIANNAVTLPVSAFTPGMIACDTSSRGTIIQSASITTIGQAVQISVSALLRIGAPGDYQGAGSISLYRDDSPTPLYASGDIVDSTGASIVLPFAAIISDSPPAGVHNYYVYGKSTASNDLFTLNRALTLLEVRK